MPGFKSNVGILNSVLRNAPKENKDMIRDLIRFYETKKIKNFRTAENAINRLGTKTKNKERVDRAKKDYIDIMKRYATAEPMTGRLTRESEKRKLNNVMLTMVLRLLPEGLWGYWPKALCGYWPKALCGYWPKALWSYLADGVQLWH